MSDELIGGRYRVINCLRTTGFCETYIAEDTHLPGNPHPRCVVKKLQPQSTEDFVLDTARRLFENEAKILYKLNEHPQIPRLLAHLKGDEEFYLVQEYIEGKDLSQSEIVPGERWSESKVRQFLIEVLEILAFVHQSNVIHRDIKPSNLIRRASDGKIFLIDFGAVKEITNMTLTEGRGNVLTVAIGTPGYMSSEQRMGNPRLNSDIYALGITAIQAITGIHPDQLPRDRDTGEINWRDRAFGCSEELAYVLDKMVRNDFLQRYRNVREALEDLLHPHPYDEPINKSDDSIAPAGANNRVSNPRKVKISGLKRLLLLAVLPLSIGLLFLTPRIWRSLQALKYYNEGNSLIEVGEYEKAISTFDRALSYRRDFAQAWLNRGFAQGKLGRHIDKFSSCERATDFAPDFAEAWNCRGLARFDSQQYERALEEYDRAINIDPDFYRGWFNKGQVLLKLGLPKEAEYATRRVLEIKYKEGQDDFLALTQLCQALYQQEQYQDAKANCEESKKIKPDYPPTITLLDKLEQQLN